MSATTRDPAKAAALSAAGIAPVRLQGDPDRAIAEAAGDASHVLVSAAPGEAGDALLAAIGDGNPFGRARWLGYLSTTGVYGDHQGAWVDETTPIAPAQPRTQRRAAAEDGWLSFGARTGIAVTVFRLAGIYGPASNPLIALREGRARRIQREGQVFSRIHVDDIAQAIRAAMAKAGAPPLVNLADDEPAAPSEVTEFAARLIGVPVPPLEDYRIARETMSPMALSFWSESKRVRNDLLKSALGVTLRYPTYREGLRALAARP